MKQASVVALLGLCLLYGLGLFLPLDMEPRKPQQKSAQTPTSPVLPGASPERELLSTKPPSPWAKAPELPDILKPAQLLRNEEVTWSNGAVQRRSIHQAGHERILLLETHVSGSQFVLRHYYSANRLILDNKAGNFNSQLSRLAQAGYTILPRNPKTPQAFVHVEHPDQLFSQLEQLQQNWHEYFEVSLEPLRPDPI